MSIEERIPQHVAIIMDGNGRWAQQRGKERAEGHMAGVEPMRIAIKAAQRHGVRYLTFYAFSTENWGRPTAEVDALMELLCRCVIQETPELVAQGVRVRIIGDEAFITFKGRSHDGGLSRFEWERPVPMRCAEALLARCRGVVEKIRHEVRVGNHVWEVDEFLGDNEGLVVAEVELASRDEQPEIPAWIWREVTGNRYYHNSFLASHPYKEWGAPKGK